MQNFISGAIFGAILFTFIAIFAGSIAAIGLVFSIENFLLCLFVYGFSFGLLAVFYSSRKKD